MKLYIIRFMASLLAAFLIFFRNNKFMPSRGSYKTDNRSLHLARQEKTLNFRTIISLFEKS